MNETANITLEEKSERKEEPKRNYTPVAGVEVQNMKEKNYTPVKGVYAEFEEKRKIPINNLKRQD